ncbi:ATP-binding cassette domain-containing protein [Mollicutes bacterium LVI A0078]|nr:ATP-binding cassette domain-containing protein [Mollicutes bacterium LVI A0075]WOO91122.1 ATP-binding cassette domain-containing protein [Mollicutes bacterium LVI A0078]
MLSISNLLYEIEDKILFENASLELSSGQYQLVGNNGVGKTSFLNIITNNIKSQAGDVRISKNFLYLSQEPLLLNNVSVKSNVEFFNKQFKDIILKELESFGIDKNKK